METFTLNEIINFMFKQNKCVQQIQMNSIEKSSCFPIFCRKILKNDFFRIGVYSSHKIDNIYYNVSLFNAICYCLDHKENINIDKQIDNIFSLVNCLCNQFKFFPKRKKFFTQIETIKELTNHIKNFKVTKKLLQYISNTFELNILIFDVDNKKILLYVPFFIENDISCSQKNNNKINKNYCFNPFKNTIILFNKNNSYEPIIHNDNKKNNINISILKNFKTIKNDTNEILNEKLKINYIHITYINSLKLKPKEYVNIFEDFNPIIN